MPRKQSLLANDSFTVAVIAGLVSQSPHYIANVHQVLYDGF